MPVCFDIGGTNIRCGWPVALGDVPIAAQCPTPRDSLDEFIDAMASMVAKAPAAQRDFVAISIAGIANPETGALTIANIECLKGVDLATKLEQRVNIPVLVANDADCLALAEAKAGVAQGSGNVLAIVLGTGVGGGIVINGEIVTGYGGISGEWGHGPVVDPTAGGLVEHMGYFQCGCGQKGCLDTVGGARGIENVHKALTGEAIDAETVLERWRAGDEKATKSIEVSAEMVARVLSTFINALGPSCVPVGGGLAHAQDLVAHIDKRVRTMVLSNYEQPLVVPAQHLKNAGLVGASFLRPPESKMRGVA
ncbi:ROK family protein [Maritalea myrionectae]|uniref:ROK family protein n=1 Tax=Maritalea myrionectae TaxID=454601 RepID=UPI00041C36B6|nr:ROK family protein [Maritalea myrionectae]